MIKVKVLPKKTLYLNNRWYGAGDTVEVQQITDEIKADVETLEKPKKKKGNKDGNI